MPKTIYVLNGPTMNLPGAREPEQCNATALADVEKLCHLTAKRFGIDVVFRQSNANGELIDWIEEAQTNNTAGLAINPVGDATTSIAILDALRMLTVPVVEVHAANVHMRESVRQNSVVSKAAKAVIAGFGADSYRLAIAGLAAMIGAKETAEVAG